MTVTVSQDKPKKLKAWDLSGTFLIESVPSGIEDRIHWSCERFWCKISFDTCHIRRYIIEEIEVEEYDDGEW